MHVLFDDRPAHPATIDRPRLVAWLDSVLRDGSDVSVAEDLPLLFEDSDRVVRRVIVEGGGPAAHAAARMIEVRTPAGTVRAAIIGTVATDPRWRRRGLGSQVIDALLGDLRARGITLAILWADVPAFYERLGFVLAGCETIFVCPRASWRTRRGMVTRPAKAADLPALREMHRREICRVRRSEAAWQALFAMPLTSFYVLERRGRALAYGVVGKGHDLGGCLHEWGGEELLLPVLVNGIFGLRPEREMYVMSPAWKTQATRAMAYHGVKPGAGALAMFRILDRESLLGSLGMAGRPGMPSADSDLALALLGDPSPGASWPAVPFYLFGLDSM